MGKLAGKCAVLTGHHRANGLRTTTSGHRKEIMNSFPTPQLIYVVLLLLGLTEAIAKHGEKRPDHDAFVKLFNTLIILALLYWGGFFK